MRRKGQFVSLLTVFTVVFIATGNIFGSFFVKNQMSEAVSYNSGGLASISEAEIRSEFYQKRMKYELNYSANIAAVELGSSEGGESWTGDDMPTREKLLGNFKTRIRQNVEGQTYLEGCGSNGPPVDSVSLDKEGWNIEKFRLELVDEPITCSEGATTASVYLDKTELELQNHFNSYMELASMAVTVANNFRTELSSSPSATRSASTSCLPPMTAAKLESSTKTEAKEKARNAVKSDIKQDASAAIRNTAARVPEIEASYSLQDLSPSVSGATIEDSYTDCDLTEDDEEEDDGDIYSATAKYEAESIDVKFIIDHTEKSELLTDKGIEELDFVFEYAHSFS